MLLSAVAMVATGAGCGVPEGTGEGASSSTNLTVGKFQLDYADTTRGVGGHFTYGSQTFTGQAATSAGATTGQLLTADGQTLASWQLDPMKGTITGTIDGKPFLMNEGELDDVSTQLLRTTPSGDTLGALALLRRYDRALA
jgi:phosphate-selective porin